MMEASSSMSMMSNRSRDSIASDPVDEIWSPEPSSGYCSADDEPFILRTPTGTGSRSDRRLSESSNGISSRSLLSLSLSEALSLTLRESPPSSPPPDHVLPYLVSTDSRSPTSYIDHDSSPIGSAVLATPDNLFPRIFSSRPDVYSIFRGEACCKKTSDSDNRIGVETRAVTSEADQSLTSLDIQADQPSTATNPVHYRCDDSTSHPNSQLQLTPSCEGNDNYLSCVVDSQRSDWSSRRSDSVDLSESAIIDEVTSEECELPRALLGQQFDGSILEENALDDDTVYLVSADGSLRRLLPIIEAQQGSRIREEPISKQPFRLLTESTAEPTTESIDTLIPVHSRADPGRCHPGVSGQRSCVTDNLHEFSVDTDSPRTTTTPLGSTTSTVRTVSTGHVDSMDLGAIRVAVGFFHSYAAVEKTSDSIHSTASGNPRSQDLSFVEHGADDDLSYDDLMVQSDMSEVRSTTFVHDRGLGNGWTSAIRSTSADASDVLQETIDDCIVCDESSTSLDSSCVQRPASKRSRSSYRRHNAKRRRRHSNLALAELEDHGYSLKATCDQASLPLSPPSVPCSAEGGNGEEVTSAAADAPNSVLAKLLLTQERLFPNEGSDGFIARRRSSRSETGDSSPAVEPGETGSSGSLLEKLLTGRMDRDDIQRNRDRIIRDRIQAPIEEDVEDDEVDLQLPDFDPGCLELENLEELWKNYGDLLGKFLA